MLNKALEDLAQDTFQVCLETAVSVHDDNCPAQSLSSDVKAKVLESCQDSRTKDDRTTLQALDTFFQRNRLVDRHIFQ